MTATVPSPVHYTQIADGPIRDAEGRALIEGTTTHTLVAALTDTAKVMARATGSVGCTQVETVHGVEIRAKWMREQPVEDDEPERDDEFSLDAVVAGLHERGIPAHVDMTGGGCATIFAGWKHVVLDGTEERADWDVAAGPGTFGRVGQDSTAMLAEFYVGPNDEGLSETAPLPDTITKASEAVAWAVDAIQRAVIETETRSYAQWNRRTCVHCSTVLVPGPKGTWLDLPGGHACDRSPSGSHRTYCDL